MKKRLVWRPKTTLQLSIWWLVHGMLAVSTLGVIWVLIAMASIKGGF